MGFELWGTRHVESYGVPSACWRRLRATVLATLAGTACNLDTFGVSDATATMPGTSGESAGTVMISTDQGSDGSTGTQPTTTSTPEETTSDVSSETTNDTPSGTTGTDTTDGESSTGLVGETAANGADCWANSDCMSLACEKFRDIPLGTCVEAAADGNTRVMGTTLDIMTLQPIASTELRVLDALTALVDPVDGAALVTVNSDVSGQFDATSMEPFNVSTNVVGVVQKASYYATATHLASPLMGMMYGPMTDMRDMFAVPAAKLDEWSGMLENDPEFALGETLPLGERGGVIGFVRDAVNGMGVAGAKVVGANAPTDAIIRYLSEDMLSFDSDMTSSNGIFVLVKPSLGEVFTVEGSTAVASSGAGEDVVYMLALTVD